MKNYEVLFESKLPKMFHYCNSAIVVVNEPEPIFGEIPSFVLQRSKVNISRMYLCLFIYICFESIYHDQAKVSDAVSARFIQMILCSTNYCVHISQQLISVNFRKKIEKGELKKNNEDGKLTWQKYTV